MKGSLSEWSDWRPPGHRSRRLAGPGGRPFDLLMATPEGEPPPRGWPCLIVLDGGRFFGAAAGAANALAHRTGKTGVAPLVIAAVRHRPEAGEVEDQRALDFTSTPCPEATWTRPQGGAAAFRAFLLETILPAVRAAAEVDEERLTLFGHSLGGLFVLETLEAAPDAFSGWVAFSPSLWWRRPPPAGAGPRTLLGCGEAETGRDMRALIEGWSREAGSPFRLAKGADHGSAPFALLPDALRHASR